MDDNKSIYFDSDKLKPKNMYVVWLDILGAKSALRRSLYQASNFVMKLHIATIDFAQKYNDITLYPMNDGIFITSESWQGLNKYLRKVMDKLMENFLADKDTLEHQFLVRGAIAYGPVVAGEGLAGGNDTLEINKTDIKGIILGMPLVQAFETEKKAPPFGIYVHESARSFAPEGCSPLHYTLHQWIEPKEKEKRKTLFDKIHKYLDWAERNPSTSMYPEKKIEKHRKLVEEYFGANQTDDA